MRALVAAVALCLAACSAPSQPVAQTPIRRLPTRLDLANWPRLTGGRGGYTSTCMVYGKIDDGTITK